MTHPVEAKTSPRKYPFVNMKISDNSFLLEMEGRSACTKCTKSRKFFCYNCYVPVRELELRLPRVKLPIKIDIIKHKNEIDGKSTAAHAPILAPDDVAIYAYPEIPDYSKEKGVVLIFPGTKSITVNQLFNNRLHAVPKDKQEFPRGHNMGTLLKVRLKETLEENGVETPPDIQGTSRIPIRKAVFIDSTWNQCRGIYKDDRVNSIKTVVLQNRISQFWRHQRGSPRWYLATIEAIHQLLLEVHVGAYGFNRAYNGTENLEVSEGFLQSAQHVEHPTDDISLEAPYNGQYDNLLFFFSHMYDLIHIYYDHNELKSYRRPI